MIIELLPSDLKSFLKEIEDLGFVLTLVGGFPRDYLYSNILGRDLDFEIRANAPISLQDWPIYYKKLPTFLAKKKIVYTEFPYLITRFEFGEFKLELSSPRTETNKDEDFTHHHFDAILDSNLSYVQSFKRRDFTINAVGVVFNFKENTDVLVDPYNGLHDLKNGILKNVSDDFFYDSVRFLRLIRFQLKFDRFAMSDDLYKRLKEFNLSKLSIHHFKEELFKSIPGKFLNLFTRLVSEHNLQIPESFKIWTKYTFPVHVSSKEEILAFVFLQDEKDALAVSQFFTLPEKKLRDLKSFLKSYEAIRALGKKDFLNLLGKSINEILDHQILKEMKNLEEKKEWRIPLQLTNKELLVDWEDWEKVTINSNELHSINAPFRSYFLYFKTIEKVFKK